MGNPARGRTGAAAVRGVETTSPSYVPHLAISPLRFPPLSVRTEVP
jgi:hypothetical protein